MRAHLAGAAWFTNKSHQCGYKTLELWTSSNNSPAPHNNMSANSGGGTSFPKFIAVIFLVSCSIISVGGHECDRNCEKDQPSKKCHYVFDLQIASTLSKSACASCFINETACLEPRCVTANGVKRTFLSINKQMPGPTIQVCQGDTVQVEVRNRLPGGAEVSVHWHGQKQRNSPHMDGVPMVTQCPIPAGASFLYTFEAAEQGTQFYHAHSVTQQSDGIFGALIVKSPSSQGYKNEHTMLIAPWTNTIQSGTYGVLNGDLHSSTVPSALLINGRGLMEQDIGEPKQLEQIKTHSDDKMLLRIINAAAIDCPVRINLQDHILEVRRVAGSDVRPVTVHSLVIFPGERYDVEVHADQPPGEYSLMVRGLNVCAKTPVQHAILRYQTSNISLLEKSAQFAKYDLLTADCSAATDADSAFCSMNLESQDSYVVLPEPNEVYSMPFGRTHVSAVSDKDLDFRFILEDIAYYPTFLDTDSTRLLVPHLNHVTFRYPASPPLVHAEDDEIAARLECESMTSTWYKDGPAAIRPRYACLSAPHYCECTHMIRVKLNATVQITLFHSVVDGIEDNAQTLHLHGHSFYVTRWRDATGAWQYVSRPVLRDTVTVPRAGAVTLHFNANNPGFWLLESRAGHVTSAGVGAAAILQVGNRSQIPAVPENFPRCSGHKPEDLIF